MTLTRTVVLVNGNRKRTYPVPLGTELQDEYWINDERWTVVAVVSTEDVPLSPMVPQ